MKSLLTFTGGLLLLCGVGLTAADGIVHGWLSFRWQGVPVGRTEAARRLPEIPATCGDWEQAESEPLDEYTAKILQCEASLNRAYVNRMTGQKVQVTVVLGPFGPTSTHTPDMCFAGRDYEIWKKRRRVRVDEASADDSELWMLSVRSKRVEGETLRVYYGWSDGGSWRAPRQPRVTFGGRPFLYKIQVSAMVPADAVSKSQDAGRAFLLSFLPAIRPCLVQASG